MENPDAVEVGQEVSQRAFFVVRLEERAIPIDSTKPDIPLSRSDIYETSLQRD